MGHLRFLFIAGSMVAAIYAMGSLAEQRDEARARAIAAEAEAASCERRITWYADRWFSCLSIAESCGEEP